MPLAGTYQSLAPVQVTAASTPAEVNLSGILTGCPFFGLGIYNPGPEPVFVVQGAPVHPEYSGLVVLAESGAQFGPFRVGDGAKLYCSTSQAVNVTVLQVIE